MCLQSFLLLVGHACFCDIHTPEPSFWIRQAQDHQVIICLIVPSFLTGPFKINACPLRRISQNYVIATETKLDISGVKLPEHINDKYFKRTKQKRAKKEEGDIFNTKKEVYQLN